VKQKIVDSQLELDPDDRLPPAAAAYATCLAAQRDLAGCDDRAVPLYSGERAQGVIFGLISSAASTTAAGQQYVIDVPCGAVALRIQTGDTAGDGTLYVRRGRPVEFDGPRFTAPRHDWAARGNFSELRLDASGCSECTGCAGSRTALGAGRWYFLRTGQTGAEFHLGVSIQTASGVTAPVRPRFELGACTWGGSELPSGGSPAFGDAPALACAAPGPVAATACDSTDGGGGSRSGGCSHASAGDGLLALLGLAALRARRRRAPCAP
jgi:MYXO-CTERM domain-containing protein